MIKTELEEWVHLYTSDLYNWAYHKTSSVEVAKDLVQDTFLAVAERQDSFQGKSTAKTWLFSILNNKIVDFYRKKSKSHTAVDTSFLSSFFNEDGEWKKNAMPKDWHEEEGHLLVITGMQL
jgi:RNA polymerase sigma-70 factor (ECF subfamily)